MCKNNFYCFFNLQAVRVTKPKIPEQIRKNYELMCVNNFPLEHATFLKYCRIDNDFLSLLLFI